MNKNYFPSTREYEVGSTWQATYMQSVAVPKTRDETANGYFRRRIPIANTTHSFASLLRSEGVHRYVSSHTTRSTASFVAA